MVEAGADILDVGARSTAPNAQAISGAEEASRIDAALKELDGTGFTISVDTMNPWVLDTCLKHEIHAVNDIAGFASKAYVQRVAAAGLPAFVMATDYTPGDAVGLAATEKTLATVVGRCEAAGIGNYVLDPGIGIWTPFRSYDDNWELCRHFEAVQHVRPAAPCRRFPQEFHRQPPGPGAGGAARGKPGRDPVPPPERCVHRPHP